MTNSLRLGPIMQIAYVVADLDAAISHWAGKLAVGPWAVQRHVNYKLSHYRGVATPADISVAFAYSGDVNIELVQQHNDAPSVFHDFVSRHGNGLQHVGVLSDDLETDTLRLADQGIALVHRLINPNGVETRFFDTEFHPGALLELIGRSDLTDAGFAQLRGAAQAWDGKEAIL